MSASTGGKRAAAVAGAGAEVLLHSCADVPWNILQCSAIHAVSVDVGTLGDADVDGLGEFLDSGRAVVLGLVPASVPDARPSAEEVAAAAVAITDRIGFSRSSVRGRVGISPVCGLAGATAAWARVAVGLCQRAADAVTEDPEAI